jgi:hypothetical protein
MHIAPAAHITTRINPFLIVCFSLQFAQVMDNDASDGGQHPSSTTLSGGFEAITNAPLLQPFPRILP